MANVVPSTASETPGESRADAHAAPDSQERQRPAPRAPRRPARGAASPRTRRAPAKKSPPGPADLEPETTRRLRAQYAEISQLAGGLAHEIRNPLSTLSLNLDLLAEDFQNPETTRDSRVRQRVDRLQHEVRRLHAILESFLRFARVQDLNLETADLNAVIDDLQDFFEPHAGTKGIVIRTRFAPDLPGLELDRDLFKQAVLNLVLNAEHAMPSGGELILTTRYEEPWVVLDVIDTGKGMPESVRAKIFDAFFSTKPGGSGLGLPTTRKIIEAHGGTIRVQSEPGKGSQFTVKLPVLRPAAAQDAALPDAAVAEPPA
jgi:two-component system, NtrC family, sensor histidine kinase HydH